MQQATPVPGSSTHYWVWAEDAGEWWNAIAKKNSGFPNKILQVDWFLIQPDPFPQYTLSEAKEMAIFEIFMALQNYLWWQHLTLFPQQVNVKHFYI